MAATPPTKEQRHALIRRPDIAKDTKAARYFLDAVQLESLGLKPYPEDTVPPLDLGTIQKKLEDKGYPSLQAFASDVRQLFDNALERWGDRDPVTKASKTVVTAVLRIGLTVDQKSEFIRVIERIEGSFPRKAPGVLRDIRRLSRVAKEVQDGKLHTALEVSASIIKKCSRAYNFCAGVLIQGALDHIALHLEPSLPQHHLTFPKVKTREKDKDKVKGERKGDDEFMDEDGGLEGAEDDDNNNKSTKPAQKRRRKNAKPAKPTTTKSTVSRKNPLNPSLPPGVSRYSQKKKEYCQKQQELYRLGKKVGTAQRARNAVIEKIEERKEQKKAKAAVKEAYKGDVLQQSEPKKERDYLEALQQLSTASLTPAQNAALECSALKAPRFLGRTASLEHGHLYGKKNESNGFTADDLLMPSADTREEHRSHDHLTDLSQGEGKYMFGNHLQWLDQISDEILSFTTEMGFLYAHALGRSQTGQKGVTIQFLQCSDTTSHDGQPAAFYHALDIYTIYEISRWSGWSQSARIALHPRKFTHELLSHGVLKIKNTDFKQARLAQARFELH